MRVLSLFDGISCARVALDKLNIPGVVQPADRGILLKDIIESGAVDRDKSYCIDASYYKGGSLKQYLERRRRQLVMNNASLRRLMVVDGSLVVPEATKAGFAIAEDGDSVDVSHLNSKTRRGRVGKKAKNLMTTNNIGVFKTADNGGPVVRMLTPTECERLQSLPDGYTDGADVSRTQRYKSLGNAFNADVIAHILSFIPEEARV
jgi:site-specific DNA-cytosine methylase